MLVISRKDSESIQIGPDITITIVRCGRGSTKVGVTAPKTIPIVRSELLIPEGHTHDHHENETTPQDSPSEEDHRITTG